MEDDETCIHPDDTRARYIFAFDQDCSTISGVALVAPEVRALIAVLGDGRVRRLRGCGDSRPAMEIGAPRRWFSEGAQRSAGWSRSRAEATNACSWALLALGRSAGVEA